MTKVLDVSKNENYFSLCIDSKLYVYNKQGELVFGLSEVKSSVFSNKNDDTIVILNLNADIYLYNLDTKKRVLVNSSKKENVDIFSTNNHEILILSYKVEKNIIEEISYLPIHIENITFVITDHLENNLFNFRIDNISECNVLETNDSGDILIKYVKNENDKIINELLIINTISFKYKIFNLSVNFNNLFSYEKFSFFYGKKSSRNGSYEINNLWVMFNSSGTIKNLSSLNKFYGNYTLSDVKSNELNNIVLSNSKLFYITSKEGDTFLEMLNLNDFSTKVIYSNTSSIHQFRLFNNNLIILESTINQKYAITVFDSNENKIKKRIDVTGSNLNIHINKYQHLGFDYYLLEHKNTKRGRTILWIPGGPMFQYGNGYTSILNKLIENGYKILIINNFGRHGYSLNNALKIRGNWGNKDLESIITIVSHLVQTNQIPVPLNIIGHSYGGYLSYLLSVSSIKNIINKIVTISSIGSKLSLFSGSDIGYLEYLESKTFPWEDIHYYFLNSPLYKLVNELDNPLLLIHGTNDKRVPIYESQQIFTWLRSVKKNVKLLIVNNADHKFIYCGDEDIKNKLAERILIWLGE